MLVSIKSRLLLAFAALMCCVSAAAQTWTPIQLNEEIQVVECQSAFYTLTPTESGMVKLVTVSGSGNNGYAVSYVPNPQKDNEFVKTSWAWATDTEPSNLSFAVEAGTTYYIALSFPTSTWSFKAVMGESFALKSVTPAAGGKFFITSNNQAIVTFTSSLVDFTDGEITANGNVIKVYNYDDYNELVHEGIFTYHEIGVSGYTDWNGNLCASSNNGIIVDFSTQTGLGNYNVINRLLEENKLREGEEIKLTIHGVKDLLTDELLDGTGEFEVTWICGGAPTTLVSADVPEKIKSWYNPDDPNAIVTFTFSKEIQSAKARLEMGDGVGLDDLYQELIAADHVIIDGKNVKVDLSGVMRTKKMMGLKYDWSEFILTLFGVVDIDGVGTFSDEQGSASSYSFSTEFQDVTTDISAAFTPESGANLTADTKSIEIWFNNSDMISWDGVEFVYYTVEEVSETDSYGNPVVTTQNVAHDVFIKKEDLKVEVVDNETTILVQVPEGLHAANNIRLAVNITSSVDGGNHVIAAYYNTTISHDLDLVRCANPINGSTVSVLNNIYLTLGMTHAINTRQSKNVRVTGTTTNFACGASIVDDGMMNVKIVLDQLITVADTYTITIPEGAVGDYVYGESNYKTGLTNEASTLTYVVDGQYAGKPIGITPAEGEVESLSNFTLVFFEHNSVAPTWNAKPYVKNADGDKFTADFEPQTQTSNVVSINLDAPISADGSYTLVVPAGAVCIGATGEIIDKEYTFDYTVKSTVTERPIVSPEEGIVEQLQTFGLQFEQDVTVNAESFATLEVAKDGTYDTFVGELVPGMVPNVIIFRLYEPITKPGDYTLTIDLDRILGEDGAPLRGVYDYHYTIEGTGPTPPIGGDPEITPAEGEVESLKYFEITFPGYNSWQASDLWPEITDANGTPVAQWGELSSFSQSGTMLPWNVAALKFENTVTADGQYTLTLPVILYDSEWKEYNKTFAFHYVIGDPTFVGRIIAADGGTADIYNAHGQIVKRAATADDLKTLRPGLYIINDKKVILK